MPAMQLDGIDLPYIDQNQLSTIIDALLFMNI
jgi:hypothetical protein